MPKQSKKATKAKKARGGVRRGRPPGPAITCASRWAEGTCAHEELTNYGLPTTEEATHLAFTAGNCRYAGLPNHDSQGECACRDYHTWMTQVLINARLIKTDERRKTACMLFAPDASEPVRQPSSEHSTFSFP